MTVALARDVHPAVHAPRPLRLALLGTGSVGGAVLDRLQRLDGDFGAKWKLVYVANSRRSASLASGIDPGLAQRLLDDDGVTPGLAKVVPALHGPGVRIVIDATASIDVAAQHAHWLRQGIHVVSACKLAQGGGLADWRRLRQAQAQGRTLYGDSATVGAGLPLLRTIRALREGGDRIHALAGILSGSLAWLFDRYDGAVPFSQCVREARRAGYTEPDPREDLSGIDVQRKLLILARSAGFEPEPSDVCVQSLLPDRLAGCAAGHVEPALLELDAPMRARHAQALAGGNVLRHVARLDHDGRARVSLEELAFGHPLAQGAGTDNKVAIWSDRYRDRPLLIQGPGAGAAITAAALIDDVLRIHSLAVA